MTPDETRENRVQDWFRPAMASKGRLDECLDRVLHQQEAKLQFIAGLKHNLCHPETSRPDRLTSLRRQVFDFGKTLETRLGLLAFDRPAAWFRPSQEQELGPFPGRVHAEPVFLPFEPLQAKVVQMEIKAAWEQAQPSIRSFNDPATGCLWTILLELNAAWHGLTPLPEPYHDIRLEELPEALPDDLHSPSLGAFLSRVKEALMACRQDLDGCFQSLWKASDPFLAKQFADACLRQRQASQARTGASDGRYQRGATGTGMARQGDWAAALAFMEFTSLPDKEALRRRYRALARRWHPDCPQGSEEKFKTLNLHYQILLRHIERHSPA
jgi:hypothetical protein